MLVREPARALLTQQWFPPRETILVNSVANAMFGIVVAAGLVATPLVLSAGDDDWRLVFRLFGALFAVLTAAWVVFGRDRPRTGDRQAGNPLQQGTLRSALHHRDLWVGGSGFVGATLAWSAYLSFYPTMMQDTYGLSLRWSGLILALTVIVGGMSGMALGYGIMAGGRRKIVLQVTGVLMAGSYLGMTLTGALPLLLPLALLNGVAWGFYPVLFTVPFHLPGIRPREVVVAVATTTTMTAIGMGMGPLLTGVLQGVIGDLRPVLIIVGFATLSVSVAGTLLRPSSESHTGTSKRAPLFRPPRPSRP
jgi:nitrate/nitrite transporter NarK